MTFLNIISRGIGSLTEIFFCQVQQPKNGTLKIDIILKDVPNFQTQYVFTLIFDYDK